MKEKARILSKRLQMLAHMVTPGNRAVDVGCDHGFLSIYLVQSGISPRVIAMDVRKGPLAAAREHINACGLGAYIETRISDGLAALKPGEADTVVCAGMGGRLMERILTQGAGKAMRFKELILQPQSEIAEFRKFLRQAGYEITEEDMVYDGGKYYFAMKAVPRIGTLAKEEEQKEPERERLYDKFGEKLLLRRNPVLGQFLQRQESAVTALIHQLAEQGTDRAEARLDQMREELRDIRDALSFYETNSEMNKLLDSQRESF